MEFRIYAIYDAVTGRTMQPTFIENDKAAKRWFKHVIENTNIFKDNPGDYDLVWLGGFEDKGTGLLNGVQGEQLFSGREVINERIENDLLD